MRRGLSAFCLGLAACVWIVAAPPVTAQEDTLAGRLSCEPDTLTDEEIRCCLAVLERRALTSDFSVVQEEAVSLRQQLIGTLIARGVPTEPLICPTAIRAGNILSISSFGSKPTVILGGGPANGGASPFRIDLSFGTVLNAPTHDIDAGGGTTQKFPIVGLGGGEVDLRFSYIPRLSDLDSAVSSAALALALYAGYTYGRYHVDRADNVGGAFGGTSNTAFEGQQERERIYIGAMLLVPLALALADSAPNIHAILGANVGPSTRTVSDQAGPFRDTQTDWTWELEAGLDIPLSERASLRGSYIFETGPNDGEHKLRFGVGFRF